MNLPPSACPAVYVDQRFVLVNKAAGVSVHRDQQQSGVLESIRSELGMSDLLPVHRLDKVTSGLWMLGRGSEATAELSALFERRQVEKYYLAISDRKPRKKQGRVSGDMSKSRRGTWRLERSATNPATTRFISQGIGKGHRLYLVKPLTGKTHQIRVALKSISAPILGDRLYSGTESDRVYLHAYAIRFELWGQSFEVVCPPDNGQWFMAESCRQQIEQWQSPWSYPWPNGG